MNPIEKVERKREAQHRLRAQRQRMGQLRSRVVAISLIAFVVLWGVVFAQMATGNDPVLGDSSSTVSSSLRSGAAGRGRATATASPAEAEASTDSEEASEAAPAATEAIETSAPEEVESEVIEPEPVEEELIEAEPEPEPAPLTTSQS